MWYQIARLITVQIALLFGCFYSVAVATIGYVAAMLLVKIEEEEVGGRVKFQDHLRGLQLQIGWQARFRWLRVGVLIRVVLCSQPSCFSIAQIGSFWSCGGDW
jgi:hypothetical protein